jgi:hypothetical protein
MATPRTGFTLYSVVRILRAVGWVTLLVVVAYLALAAYSVVRLHPTGSGGGSQVSVSPDGTVEITARVNLTNPGYFAFSGLVLSARVALPHANGTWLESSSTPLDLPANGARQLLVTFSVPLGSLGAAESLLTQDAMLNETEYVNGTYASLIGFSIENLQNASWGAPFFGFHATVQTGTVLPNGTIAVPVQIAFANHASFSLQGVLRSELRNSAGATCGTASFPVNAPPQTSVNQTSTAYLSSGCSLAGGEILSTYSAPAYAVPLPPEPLP